jgi:hypothetical protein
VTELGVAGRGYLRAIAGDFRMADDNGGGGSGFMGVIIGALLVAVLVVGFMAYNGGFGGGGDSASIQIETPEVPSGG